MAGKILRFPVPNCLGGDDAIFEMDTRSGSDRHHGGRYSNLVAGRTSMAIFPVRTVGERELS